MKTKFILLIPLMLSLSSIQAQYGSMVREDWIWDYDLSERYQEHYFEGPMPGYHFEGTKTFDGVTYAIFCDGDGNPLIPMRQNGPRIYIYIEPEGEGEYLQQVQIADYELDGYRTGEVLLYDFSLQKGDRFFTPCFPTFGSLYGELLEFEVKDTYVEEHMGVSYVCQEIFNVSWDMIWNDAYKVIEGMGNPRGRLPFPQTGERITGLIYQYYNLATVRDSAGNTIYPFPTVGVTTSMNETRPDSEVIYDLYGRPVSKPLPGTIYVKNGKKVVW